MAHHERLSPTVGLAVFSSDALSSVAYATEAILSILVLMSAAALGYQFGISMAVLGLIAVISFSYRQTIRAYPTGGGSYIVASENLGETPGVIAGAALLIDYVLTVAVSIAAGVAALSSAFPVLHPYLVWLSVLFTMMVAWANLRGMRESGIVFAFPTYGFVILMFVTLVAGIWRTTTHGGAAPTVIAEPGAMGSEANYPLLYIILRAFAAGCTALTGIEAVADGVQAFRPPEAKNAIKTLTRMAVILATLFLGMGYVATHLPTVSLLSAKNPEYKTLAAQVAQYAYGPNHPLFFLVQFFTAAILILAANTAFADFPRLSSFLARDGYLPRYMARQGDRLVFHNGILALAGAAIALIVIFHGELDQLLPLYAVGVFTAFTLSQAGMVSHWRRTKEPGWQRSMAINVVGTVLCFVVLLIILVTKFTEGAWVVAILLPIICLVLVAINRRYRAMSRQLAVEETAIATDVEHVILLLIPRVHRGTLSALDYATQLRGEIQAVHVTINERALPELQRKWQQFGRGVPLVVLASPYRSLIQPVMDYVDQLREERPGAMITVVVVEAVSTKWYQKILSENVAQQLKVSLARRKNVVVANVRYFLN
jgi:amino acid transporter